jgi:hypothetical protein
MHPTASQPYTCINSRAGHLRAYLSSSQPTNSELQPRHTVPACRAPCDLKELQLISSRTHAHWTRSQRHPCTVLTIAHHIHIHPHSSSRSCMSRVLGVSGESLLFALFCAVLASSIAIATHSPQWLAPKMVSTDLATTLVCGGQPSPHKPRLVVSHSTCPPLSSSPTRTAL